MVITKKKILFIISMHSFCGYSNDLYFLRGYVHNSAQFNTYGRSPLFHFFGGINTPEFRVGFRPDEVVRFERMRRAILGASEVALTPRQLTRWDGGTSYSRGQVFYKPEFVSATRSPLAAVEFKLNGIATGYSPNGRLVTIDVPEGTRVWDVDPRAAQRHAWQMETVISEGNFYRAVDETHWQVLRSDEVPPGRLYLDSDGKIQFREFEKRLPTATLPKTDSIPELNDSVKRSMAPKAKGGNPDLDLKVPWALIPFKLLASNEAVSEKIGQVINASGLGPILDYLSWIEPFPSVKWHGGKGVWIEPPKWFEAIIDDEGLARAGASLVQTARSSQNPANMGWAMSRSPFSGLAINAHFRKQARDQKGGKCEK